MNPKKALVLTIGVCALGAILFLRPLRFLENIVYDLNFPHNATVRQDSVVIVGIDPAGISEVGAWPWPRGVIARCLEQINACDPAAVAVDVLFPPRTSDPAGNAALAAALCKVKNLVLPFRAGAMTHGAAPAAIAPSSFVYAQRFLMLSHPEKLGEISFFTANRFDASDTLFSSCALRGGVINVTTSSSSQKLRQVVQVIKAGDDYYPSFSLSAAAAFLNCKPDEFILDGNACVRLRDISAPITRYAATTPIHFRGRAGAITTISAAQVLGGHADPALLRGKLVFFGVTDPATGADFFTTPVGSQYPGVEMWATAALDILQKSWIREASRLLDFCNILLAFLLFPGALLIPGSKKTLALSLATALALSSLCAGMFTLRADLYFWNPVYHGVAWLMCLITFAARKNMPFLADYLPIDFTAPASVEKETPAPPREEEFTPKLPDAPSAFFVARKLNITPGTLMPGAKPHETFSGTVTEDNNYSAGPAGAAPPQAEAPNLEAVLTLEERARFGALGSGRIVKLLGSGGMADVYLVWNPRLEVYRAVKVLKPGQPATFLSRFETEIRILSKLMHPHIVQFFSVGEWHGLPFIEMEYVQGAAMDDVYSKCTALSPAEAMAVGILTCRALQYAHTQPTTIYGAAYKGVIHRDLKPANIMLNKSGMVKLTDFGIARPEEVSLHTMDVGKVVGTLPYLAPEQFDGSVITPQVDIYAAGATLYEFLTGERAFPQTDVNALLMAKVKGAVNPLPGHIPKNLAAIIEKAMAGKPAERYAGAHDMERDLEKALRSICSSPGYAILQGLVKRFNGQGKNRL